MNEEKNLTPNPSEEVAEVQAEVNEVVENSTVVEKPEAVEPAAEAPAAEPTLEAGSNTPEAPYETETVTSGPLSDIIRVIHKEDLKDDTQLLLEQEVLKYEKSLTNVSQDERIIGKVVAVTDNDILLDIGFKSEGIVSLTEFAEGETPKVGDEIEVFVEQLEDEDGEMVLSKRKADFMRVWQRVKEMFNNNEIVEGKIKSRIKGGMVVDIMGIDAFLPGSQLDVRPVTDFDAYVGKSFEYRIVKLSELRKNIVLSRKTLLAEDLKEKRDELLSNIKVGDVLTGKVKNITDFGVFVDLGGLDGLLHITDLSWGRINHPREVVSLDQEIEVKVIDYDDNKQRVSLGLKQLTPHPWEGIEQRYPVDSIVKGKIVNIANYGVFVELEKGVEGLIHISEISWTKHIKHPSEVFQMGEEVEAKVLAIDTEERKISLGFKQLEPDPWEDIDVTYAVDVICEGTVSNIRPHGFYVTLKDNIDGFVKMEDISWTKKIRHPKEIVKKGDVVTVKVLELSKEERKIILGMKQIEENPWAGADKLYVEGAIVEGEVKKIAAKLVVVKLNNDLEGIIPLSEFPKEQRNNVKDFVNKGDMLQLKVIELDMNESRIVLSRQQAIPQAPTPEKEATPAEKYMSNQVSIGETIDIPQDIINKIAQAEKAASKAKKEEETTVKEAEETPAEIVEEPSEVENKPAENEDKNPEEADENEEEKE
ncbi:MAG: 30S ribosomal protein S1 [Candidatus Marinimicrobia bacterium]|nr:30S ribosomal protein S1 [Candidatus Neomarinimicrobiota bacterium]